jgi:hypothetical protein
MVAEDCLPHHTARKCDQNYRCIILFTGKIASMWNFLRSLKTPELRLAWAIAIAADTLQIFALPLFAEGALSPADGVLDLIVAVILTRLLGWHWAFLPTLAAEMVPGLDLIPTWTMAVFYVTQKMVPQEKAEPEILPPGPAPAPRP